MWVGLSLARKLGERWSVGATLFGINHSATSIVGVDFQSPAMPMQAATAISRDRLSTWGLSATLGATYVAAAWIRIALRAPTASFQLAGSAATFHCPHNSPPANENLAPADPHDLFPFD